MTEPTLESPFWNRPATILLSVLAVFLPALIILSIAHFTGIPWFGLATTPVCLALAWTVVRLRGKSWRDFGLRQPASILRLILVSLLTTVGVFVMVAVLSTILSALTGWKPDLSQYDTLRGNVPLLLVGLVYVWIFAGFGEELLFRGFLMHSLQEAFSASGRSRLAWSAAILLTAVAFGLGHLYQGMAGVVLTACVSLAFTAAYFAVKRSLWPAILSHGLYDTLGFVIVFLSLDKLAQ